MSYTDNNNELIILLNNYQVKLVNKLKKVKIFEIPFYRHYTVEIVIFSLGNVEKPCSFQLKTPFEETDIF